MPRNSWIAANRSAALYPAPGRPMVPMKEMSRRTVSSFRSNSSAIVLEVMASSGLALSSSPK